MIDKTYVSVISRFTRDGNIQPLFIVYEAAGIKTSYPIEKILEYLPDKASQAGSCGSYYRCLIRGRLYHHKRNLFFEKRTGKWFVETRR